MAHKADISPLNDVGTTPSTSLVLYDPNLYQNRSMMPLPVGWNTSSKSLTSFTFFPKLPAEIRLAIWKLAPEPRLVNLTYAKYGRSNERNSIISTTPPPTLLSVCRETRHEALKHYKNVVNSSHGTNIYFDASIDTLFWTPECLSLPDVQCVGQTAIWENLTAERSNIEKLVLPCSAMLGMGPRFKFEDGRSCFDEIFSREWGISRDASRRASNFSLLWIFQFFDGLKEINIDWHPEFEGMSADATEGFAYLNRDHLQEQYLRIQVGMAHIFADNMIQYHKEKHPAWNPPKIQLSWVRED